MQQCIFLKTMNRKQHNNSIIRRVVLISTGILLLGLIGVFFFSQWLSEFFPTYYASIQTGLMLFMIWLVITSTLRSLQKLVVSIRAWILPLVGTVVTAFGLLLYWAFLGIYGAYTIGYAVDFSWTPVYVFTGLGGVVSIMTLINLRIKNRRLGNLLELLLVLLILCFIVQLTT